MHNSVYESVSCLLSFSSFQRNSVQVWVPPNKWHVILTGILSSRRFEYAISVHHGVLIWVFIYRLPIDTERDFNITSTTRLTSVIISISYSVILWRVSFIYIYAIINSEIRKGTEYPFWFKKDPRNFKFG